MEKFNAAEVYENNSADESENGKKLMELLDLKWGSKVLDLGCGTGFLTKALSNIVGPEGKVYMYTVVLANDEYKGLICVMLI